VTNAEYEAEELIKNFDITIPIDPKNVCDKISSESLRIEYIEQEITTENVCGISFETNDGAMIIINSKITLPARRLFTAAHELGHVILHIQTGKQNKSECSSHDLRENKALR